MLGVDEGMRKEGWRGRENMSKRFERLFRLGYRSLLLFCLFEGVVEGLS